MNKKNNEWKKKKVIKWTNKERRQMKKMKNVEHNERIKYHS